MAKKKTAKKAGKKIITYSRMDAFGCPYYFLKQGYVKDGKINESKDQDIGKTKPVSQPPEFGTAMHEVFKDYVNYRTEGKDVWPVLDNVQRVFKASKIVPERFAEFREVCENGIKNLDKNIDYEDVLEVEETWEIDLGNGWILRLTPDLVLNTKKGLTILDHKSDMYKRTTADLDEDFQTSVYAWALHKKYGVDKVIVLMHFSRYRGFVKSIREGEETFKNIEIAIMTYCEKIDACLENNNGYERMCSNNCKYCDERVTCLASKVDGFSNYDDEKIMRFAGQYKRTAAQLEEHAKSRMTKRDPIVIDGKPYGFVLSEGKTPAVDKDKAIEIFDNHNIPWKHLCSLSNTNIKAITNKADPQVQDEIKKYSEIPIKSSFKMP